MFEGSEEVGLGAAAVLEAAVAVVLSVTMALLPGSVLVPVPVATELVLTVAVPVAAVVLTVAVPVAAVALVLMVNDPAAVLVLTVEVAAVVLVPKALVVPVLMAVPEDVAGATDEAREVAVPLATDVTTVEDRANVEDRMAEEEAADDDTGRELDAAELDAMVELAELTLGVTILGLLLLVNTLNLEDPPHLSVEPAPGHVVVQLASSWSMAGSFVPQLQ